MGGGGGEAGHGCPGSLNPVFKSIYMSVFGVDRTGEQRFPCCGNHPIICSPLFRLLLSYYQWVRLGGKQGGDGRGKVWLSFFDTVHVCLFKNSLPCQLVPVSIDAGSQQSVSRCLGAGDCWILGYDSQSVCFYCLCLHMGLLRTWS